MSLSNKKVLCIGNQSSQTDKFVTLLAKKNHSVNKGLVNDPGVEIQTNGFNHTSLADIDIFDLETFALKFDYIIYIKQNIKTYDDEELYYTTRHAIVYIENRLKLPVDTMKV